MPYVIAIATEDQLSEAVAERLLDSAPVAFASLLRFGKQGFGYLKVNIRKFNDIARTYPVLLLTDLDNRTCASELISDWLTIPKAPDLLFRVAIREVEAWLLADHEGISHFLNISTALCPGNPDGLVDPKRELLNLAKASKRREIKQDILPAKGSLSPVGVGYNARLSDFVWNHWDISRAISRSDSLHRAWRRICALT